MWHEWIAKRGANEVNEGVSVHALIEKESERKLIYVPDESYCLVRWAKTEGTPYNVKEKTSRDFYNFKDLLENENWVKDVGNEKMKWTQIKGVKVKGNVFDRIEYKYDFDFSSSQIHQKKQPTQQWF